MLAWICWNQMRKGGSARVWFQLQNNEHDAQLLSVTYTRAQTMTYRLDRPAGGAVLFSIYLIFDLQLIMGNGELAIEPDEYVLATLNIYLDVINLFLYILQLVSQLTRDSQN